MCGDLELNYPGFCQTCYTYLTTCLNVPVEHDRFLVLWETQHLFREAISKVVLKALEKQARIDIENLNARVL